MTATQSDSWFDRYDSADAIVALVDGLLDRTWPEPQWKHREHCVATLGLLTFRPEIDLDRELPGIIQRYNLAQGGVNSDVAGYHHTMTVLFLNAVRSFRKRLPAAAKPEQSAGLLLRSPIGRKDYPLAYYSRERLFSKSARLGWIEPDVAVPLYPLIHI